MPKIKYLDIRFNAERRDIVVESNRIITSYTAQGFRLTLRQLYYRLVANDLFPDTRKWVLLGSKWVRDPNGTKNAEPNYQWLGDVINDARLAGLIDWSAIEDRTRELAANSHWDTPVNVIESARDSYLNDLWRWQPIRCEVWVEKDALEGVVESACRPLDVPFFSCRGYTSQTAMWDAGQRIIRRRKTLSVYEGKFLRKGAQGGRSFKQKTVIFHLGDHDPSGIDMTRDVADRLEMFTGEPLDIRRLALNMDQVRTYNPPPNPAKSTDSRFRSYLEVHGNESWELDALEPAMLVALIQTNIRSVMDAERFEEAQALQEKGREDLTKIADNYDDALAAVTS